MTTISSVRTDSLKSQQTTGEAGRKWNILMLNSIKFMGGGETSMLRMGKLLTNRGHNTCLVVRPKTRLYELAKASGVTTEGLRISGDLNPILLWKLAALVRKYSIEIIIANSPRDIRIAGLVSLFFKNLTILGLYQVDIPIEDRWNYRLTFNYFADALIANSRATKETLRKNNPWLNQKKIAVIPHGIDPEKYRTGERESIRSSLGLPSDAFVVGFVGRFCRQKGIDVLLPTMERIAKKYPNVHFVLVGTGKMEEEMKQFIQKAQIAHTVHFLGFREDIPAIMQAFDVLLVPSIWEGFGLVLIEAMAANVPCIASHVSSIPEIIEDNVNGLLVPAGDVDALASALERFLLEPALRDRFSSGAHRSVEEKFTTLQMIQSYEKVFALLRNGVTEIEGIG